MKPDHLSQKASESGIVAALSALNVPKLGVIANTGARSLNGFWFPNRTINIKFPARTKTFLTQNAKTLDLSMAVSFVSSCEFAGAKHTETRRSFAAD